MKFVNLLITGLLVIFFLVGPPPGNRFSSPARATKIEALQSPPDNPSDIQWFKKELGIAPKYRQQDQGIYGMSWAHFLVMGFLVLFFFAAIAVAYHRSRKTREILISMLEKEAGEK